MTPEELKARFEAWATKNGTYDLRPYGVRMTSVRGEPYDGYVRPYLCDRTVYTFQGFCAALGAPEAHSQDGYDFWAGRLAEPWKAVPFDAPAISQQRFTEKMDELDKRNPGPLKKLPDTLASAEQHPCWSCKKPVTLAQRSEADGDCPHCRAELELADWPLPKEPT